MPPDSGYVDWGGRFLPIDDPLYTGILVAAVAVVMTTAYLFMAWLPEHVRWFSDRAGEISASIVCAVEAVTFAWILLWPSCGVALGVLIAVYMLVWLYRQIWPTHGQ